jgi:hypothetical protein
MGKFLGGVAQLIFNGLEHGEGKYGRHGKMQTRRMVEPKIEVAAKDRKEMTEEPLFTSFPPNSIERSEEQFLLHKCL